MTTTYTKYYRLPKPDFLSEPWVQGYWDSFDAVDAALFGAVFSTGTTVWANSTAYPVGSMAIDIVNGTTWMCAQAHTSAAAPTTFAADRAAHPSNWVGIVTQGPAGPAGPTGPVGPQGPTGSSDYPGIVITSYGAVGDGVTDCTAAFNAAVAALPNGGLIHFPPGVWYAAGGFVLQSNIHLMGSGQNATTLTSDGNHYSMITPWPLTGTQYNNVTTYAINTPTQGANTVTTTNASDAGNFAPGDTIYVSGSLHGTSWWFPGYVTTVASVNAGTGIITLNETLPIGGSDVQLVQKVLVYVTNAKISDLTVSTPAVAATGGIQVNMGRDLVFERVAVRTQSATRHAYIALCAVRNAYFQNSSIIGGFLDFLGCCNSSIVNSTVQQSVVVFDGGTHNSSIVNNTITDPYDAGAPTTGIIVSSSSQHNRIIGNVISGQAAQTGISIIGGGTSGLTGAYGWNIVAGNAIFGTNTATVTGMTSSYGTNNVFIGNIVNTAGTGINVSTNSTGTVVSGNQFVNVPNPVVKDATAGVIPVINDSWNIVPAGTTTPDVTFGSLLQTSNTSATNITSFLGGIQGQEATLWINDANTQLVYGGTFVLQQLANYSPPSGTIMKFSYRNGIWREMSRSVNAVASNVNYRGLTVGPGGGGLTISSIALQAATRKGMIAIDANNLLYYDPGLTTATPQVLSGTAGTLGNVSSATIAATGAFTLTFPASPLTGAWMHLVSTTAQTVQSASANVIPLAGGSAGTAIFSATSPPHWCILQYNGTNWVTFAAA